MIDKRTQFQLSQDSEVLRARLLKEFRDRKTDYEHRVAYEGLSQLLGGDVSRDTNLSSKLTQSMRWVSQELGITLGRDSINKAVVLLRPDEYTPHIDSKTKVIRRAAKRVSREASRMSSLDGVDQEQRQQLLARSAVAGAVAAFSGRKTVANLEQHAKQLDGPIPLNKTLEAFTSKS